MQQSNLKEATLFTPDVRAIKLVDTREPQEIRQRLLELGWQQKTLFSADFAFNTRDYKKVGITRKEVSDLMNSIGQIFSKQLEEMIDYYDIKVILLEGSWARVTTGQMLVKGIRYRTWDMVWNYLRRWQDKGFTLELTMSMGHTIDRLNKLYALYQKPYSLSAMTRKFTDDRVLSMPSGTRGKTGQKVLDELGSIQAVANTSIERLLQIEGIGQKKADLVYNHFRKDSRTLQQEKQ